MYFDGKNYDKGSIHEFEESAIAHLDKADYEELKEGKEPTAAKGAPKGAENK